MNNNKFSEKFKIVNRVLGGNKNDIKDIVNIDKTSIAFAPINIALCKYWGKRNELLNLPVTDSLSLTLPTKGAKIIIRCIYVGYDKIVLNNLNLKNNNLFYIQISEFLDLFRMKKKIWFHVILNINIPCAVGLASSSCIFAVVIKGLNYLFDWNLNLQKLSILSRLGSGSACRSMWNGFVVWKKGTRKDGMDSFGVPLSLYWPDIRVGLLLFNKKKKIISSRMAMKITKNTSKFYSLWKKIVYQSIDDLKNAILNFNFVEFGEIVEKNSLEMHALMLSSFPPIIYMEESTIQAIQKIIFIRKSGLKVYFTQDAGSNLKIIFLNQDIKEIYSLFSNIEVINPFY